MQREDDKEEIVQSRLNTYHEQTEPLVRYYQTQGILKALTGLVHRKIFLTRLKKL
ncbi:MAG: hypothetical protein CM1200mP30_06370 [Pseudomonadota bacterium]|nr:MAG: hypothetical protein CM1200mP30_06370 [Pseudomonadota bacterium]